MTASPHSPGTGTPNRSIPYPGITTTIESLWMGVAMLTLAGESFLSRQGNGLLTNTGLTDWIARDQDNYVAKAVWKRFARDFADGLRRMGPAWCQSRSRFA